MARWRLAKVYCSINVDLPPRPGEDRNVKVSFNLENDEGVVNMEIGGEKHKDTTAMIPVPLMHYYLFPPFSCGESLSKAVFFSTMTPTTKSSKPTMIPFKDFKTPQSPDGVIDQDLAEGSYQVRRKVDWILLPLLGFCYFLQFLDKQTLSYASLLGMLQDNNLHGSQFSWTASIFYFGYIFWSYPTMFLSVRLPIGKYLGATV